MSAVITMPRILKPRSLKLVFLTFNVANLSLRFLVLVLIQVAARICLIERLGTSNLFNCTKALRSPLMNHMERLPRLLRRGSLTLSIDRSRSAISQNIRYTELSRLTA